jgi:glycosyltransferase involved in cell wall biosynthesis
LKLTDGMAMAKPVLTTRVGDIPEILGNAGYIVEPSAPAELATQIQWIFDHWDEATANGRQARARCVEYYSTDAMTTILSEVVERCLLVNA